MSSAELKIFNFIEAAQFYTLISPFLPDKIEPETEVLEFAQAVVSKMAAQHSNDLSLCVALLSGKDEVDILKLDPFTVITLFIDGLIANDIIAMTKFFGSLR